MEDPNRSGGQALWISLFRGGPSGNCAWPEQSAYLWGHLTAVHDAMLPLLALRERLHPEFDVPFISNPDRLRADIPSHEQVRGAWSVVNAELWKGFEKMSPNDWALRHTSVSEEDFAKDPSRNRFAVLLSRTNHLSYHVGQAVLALKSERE
jgi:hypothetical protein